MIIGNFTKDGGGYTGHIKTLTLDFNIRIEPVSSKTTPKAPDFRIVIVAGEQRVTIGAAWKKTSKEGKPYLSVKIEYPAFSLTCALFATADGAYVLTWNRR